MEIGAPRVVDAMHGPDTPVWRKCGVCSGCQSWVYTANDPAAIAFAISAPITGIDLLRRHGTNRLPDGSAKSFCTSTTSNAERSS